MYLTESLNNSILLAQNTNVSVTSKKHNVGVFEVFASSLSDLGDRSEKAGERGQFFAILRRIAGTI